VRLVGFIEKKFVTMHGHMNVKFGEASIPVTLRPPHISHGPTRNRNQPPRWHTGEQEPELRHGATLCTISKSQSYGTALHYVQYPRARVTARRYIMYNIQFVSRHRTQWNYRRK